MSDEIRITLLSDTTFSRGVGTPGEVDVEVAHDEDGLPYVPGKTLRGLLREAWLAMAPAFRADEPIARNVLGVASDLDPSGTGRLDIRSAVLPEAVQAWVRWAVHRSQDQNPLSPRDILHGFTDIRHQTARDRTLGGSPEANTLRASRVVVRGGVVRGSSREQGKAYSTTFIAPLLASGFTADHWRLLARLCLAVRHVGSGRRRGRGHVRLSLWRGGTDCTSECARLGVADA